ncbi:MAG: DUF2004 domain-containing protein [Prevotellaceae bacterium]|jgi:hypothetical protein|nr:DUF2004 domain-containing protein [Prevotellaceae bacterium]
MKKYTLPYFGDIEPNEGDDFFETDTIVKENDLNLSIDFEGEYPTKESLDSVKQFLSQLPVCLEKARYYIDQEFSKVPSFVKDYISFFKETMEENGDIEAYVDENDSSKSIEERLLNRFYLLRISICPNGDTFAILDYTIDDEYTDDLLVVYLTDKGEPYGMTIES